MSEVVITVVRFTFPEPAQPPKEADVVPHEPAQPLDQHDRFISTGKLVEHLDVHRSTFYRAVGPRLLASQDVRVLDIVNSAKGRRWHLGDVVAFLQAR